MTDHSKALADLTNLRRAYRWLRTNPEPTYKSYFRDSFTAYAVSPDQNLAMLRQQLLRGEYEPTAPSRVYLPKPSGVTRAYTLLTLTDQIVYQGCANVIAERLVKRVSPNYFKTVFGHMYAGSRSLYFYRKWQIGYQAYSNAISANIESGHNYVATFDLAAFYDSIDHRMLSYFLLDLGLDRDFIEFLVGCLRRWTASHLPRLPLPLECGHGIPQGPLASGLLSEVVLQHTDKQAATKARGRPVKHPRYLRYVDDVRLFAQSEILLRRRLVELDLAAKEIGLFAQGAKIKIRRVVDPSVEVKSISADRELVETLAPNQARIRRRLLKLSRRGVVSADDRPRFRYLLGGAAPHYSLNSRMVAVLRQCPDLYRDVVWYFSRYTRLPHRAAAELLEYLKSDEIYHTTHAALLAAVIENVGPEARPAFLSFCRLRMQVPSVGLSTPQATYRGALIGWLVRWGAVSYAELDGLVGGEKDWWVEKDWLKYLSSAQFGAASYQGLLNRFARVQCDEAARISAMKMVDDDVDILWSDTPLQLAAQILLRESDLIMKVEPPRSGVGRVLKRVLDAGVEEYAWTNFFGRLHSRAQHLAFEVNRAFDSDIDTCIVRLDSLLDLMWEAAFSSEVPGTPYGSYGGMLDSKRMAAKFPVAVAGLKKLHQLRLTSSTSHPRMKSRGGATRRLRHADFRSVARGLRLAVESIADGRPSPAARP